MARKSLPAREATRRSDLTSDQILSALPPELVIQLARLAGQTLDSLSITFAFMTYPYRAALQAYRLIQMDPAVEGESRTVTALPLCAEVTAAAANHLADMVDPARVAASFSTTGSGRQFGPWIPTVPSRGAADDDQVVVPIVVVRSGPVREEGTEVVVTIDDRSGSNHGASERTELSFVTDSAVKIPDRTRASLLIPIDEAYKLGVVAFETTT